jgi:hypothetical protein
MQATKQTIGEVRWVAGETSQVVYWAKAVLGGLDRFRRQVQAFGVRGGLWREQIARAPEGTTFTVWFDAGDRDSGQPRAVRSWPQHRACYVCVVDPAVSTRLNGTGKYQYGFVEGGFRVVEEEKGEHAGRLLHRTRRASESVRAGMRG